MVVGAHKDDDNGSSSGSAYVFTKTGDGWTTVKVTASDGAAGDEFGISVAVDGDTVVVGAHKDDASNTVTNSGSAYVFTKPDDGWNDNEYDGTETAKLTASDGVAGTDGSVGDQFGYSVTVDGDTVVVGAPNHGGPGATYVFSKPDDGWDDDEYDGNETAKLTPGVAAGIAEGLAGTFGASVAVGGEMVDVAMVEGITVVVGAPAYAGNQGRAYVFTKPSDGWATTSEAAELATSDAEKNQFGWSIAAGGGTVVVGTHFDDDVDSDGNTVSDSGSAYLYDVSGWTAIPYSATNATSYTVIELINDEEYGFWIRARNTVGAGAASEPVAATPKNTAPTAVNDAATMYEDKVVTIVVTGNDSDIDPIDTLSVKELTTPGNGTAVLASGSTTTVTYTPNANYNGSDSFVYTLTDGTDTDTGTVTITVTAVNDAPTAVDDSTSTAEDTAVDITVVNSDTDPDTGDTVTISSYTSPSNGAASPSSTTFTYTPNPDFNGSDSFNYTLSDETDTDTGTVTITVTAVNYAPTAVADSATTTQGTAVDINVVANDTDVEGNTLSVTAVTTPSNGTAVKASNTTVTYTPGDNFDGVSFDYTLSDGTATATGTVTITVAEASALPTKPAGFTAIAGLGQVTLDWTDPFDGSITKYEYSQSSSESDQGWADITNSANGGTNGSSFTVTGLTNGTTYSFELRTTNSAGTSDATDPVTATPGNAAPTFDDDSPTSRSVEENSEQGTNVGDPVAATDPEGDTLTYSLSSAGTDDTYYFSIDADNGQITVASGANLEYEGAKSSYSVKVSVHDRKDIDGLSDTTTIDDTITVIIELTNVDEAPTKPTGLTATRGNARVTLRWEDDLYDRPITGRQYLSERQVAKLTTGDGAENDYFGYSVAVDGDTAVVGAYGEDNNKGAAYVLVRQSGSWSQVAKLTALDGQDNDQFGRSVAVDGDTAVVAAALGDGGVDNAGAAYVFTKPDRGWGDTMETAKLTASDGSDTDLFGFSLAVDGNSVVVGAYWDDDNGDDSGSVYVFTKPNTGWANASETVKLTPSDRAAADSFGISVALDGDTMAVGAYQVNHVDGDGNTVSNSGAAYVFIR